MKYVLNHYLLKNIFDKHLICYSIPKNSKKRRKENHIYDRKKKNIKKREILMECLKLKIISISLL